MARPRVHDENLRARLLGHAGRLVTENGMAALSLRTLAADAGTSTTAVYSLFGGKSELLGALFEESFHSFGAAQRAVPVTGDVIVDLLALGHAYWTWAQEHPHLYGVMFSQVLADFARTPEQLAASATTIEPLAGAVAAGVRSGVLVGDPFAITFAIWAAVHGVVSLAMAGCLPGDMIIDEGLFTATAAATVRGFRAGPA
jgi:AcrR family transcriptional regulator